MLKKAISNVVMSIILILLVMVMFVLIYVSLNKGFFKDLEENSYCFDNKDKIFLNNIYTCYNSSSNEFYFNLGIEEVDLDKLIFLIESKGLQENFELTKNAKVVNNLRYFTGNYGELIKLPDENSGKVYSIDLASIGFLDKPDYFGINSFMKGQDCGISDSVEKIYDCSLISKYYS
jgi:hypothetical protein